MVVSTHLKNISQNSIISPCRVENNKYLKPPPRKLYWCYVGVTTDSPSSTAQHSTFHCPPGTQSRIVSPTWVSPMLQEMGQETQISLQKERGWHEKWSSLETCFFFILGSLGMSRFVNLWYQHAFLLQILIAEMKHDFVELVKSA